MRTETQQRETDGQTKSVGKEGERAKGGDGGV